VTNRDDPEVVLGLACLTESRTDAEQKALLRVAKKLDRDLTKQTITNRHPKPAHWVDEVMFSRVLYDDDKPVALPKGSR